MKTILIAVSAASLILLSVSCRTFAPLNPNTGDPDCSMMPENHEDNWGSDCTSCKSKSKVESSK